jgi:hypothetical protein
VGFNFSEHWAVILHYDGSSWLAMSTADTFSPLYSVWGSSSSDVFVVGFGDSGSVILHYNGSSWSTVPNPTVIVGGTSVWGTSATDVFDVGTGILQYDGLSWSSDPCLICVVAGLNGVWGSSSTDVFAVGGWWADKGQILVATVILHYDGSSWSAMKVPIMSRPVGLFGVWGASGADVFAVGNSGTILHYGPPESPRREQ